MTKTALQETDTARLELSRAELSLNTVQLKLEQVQQYLAELSESVRLLKSRQIPIVSIREYRIIKTILPRLIAEESHLETLIKSKQREIDDIKEDLRISEKP